MTDTLTSVERDLIDQIFLNASILVKNSDFVGAQALYRKILTYQPENPRALHALGVVLYRGGGNSGEAVQLVRMAIGLNPDFLDAYYNLRKMLIELGRFADADECFQAAISIKPKTSHAWRGIGNLYCQKLLFEESIYYYQKSVDCEPDANSFVSLGNALKMLNRLQDAASAFRSAIALQENCGEAYCGLAMVYESAANLVAAKEYVQKALELMPTSSACMQIMAGILRATGRADEAVDWYRRAVEAGGGTDALSMQLYAMNFSSRFTQEQILQLGSTWESLAGLSSRTFHFPPRKPGRLRIGYVSPDFWQHSVAYFFEPVLAAHNSRRFEIFCYSNVHVTDKVTERLRRCSEHWIDIRHLSDEEATAIIREDGIDILIDLTGHMSDNRLGIFARRAAPVQMTWIGYPNTTSLSTMDYRITDAVADPEGDSDSQHSEHLIRLPDSFLCYQLPPESPDVAPPPSLLNNFVTFGCFNYPAKITPEVIALWSRILLALPNSRLLLKAKSFCDPEIAQLFSKAFVAHGLPSERIIIVPATETTSSHLSTYNQIDIALDPFPYNGTTTTFETLFMGVPVVTLRGSRHAGRVGASILTNMGLTELIADTEYDYYKKSIDLARDKIRLSAYHSDLRNILVSSRLVDAERFADFLEDAYCKAWNTYSHAHPHSSPAVEWQLNTAKDYFVQCKYADAKKTYEEIITVHPENPRALHGMGVVCHWLSDSESAIDYISRAVQLKPDYPVALTNLGNIYREVGRVGDAIASFKQALGCDPCFSEVHSNILMNMQCLPEYSCEENFRESQRWSDFHARRPFKEHSGNYDAINDSGKIRIGFVSADFRNHPVGFFILPFISEYDREKIEVFCYNNCADSDEITQKIVLSVEVSRQISGISDLAAWHMIHDDAIDVLVDLSGHTAGNRLVLFSMRPAPVQVTWLGYPGTTGISAMDYRITDAIADPDGSDIHHSECLLRLPDGFLCYNPPNDPPDVAPPPALTNGYITFGSFNNLAKITPQAAELWCSILLAVPNSRLFLKSKSFLDARVVNSFISAFVNNGVSSERIICVSATDTYYDHLSTYNRIDIALDTFPYNGTTTTIEALYMGVPVIALSGNRHAGRVGASILNRLELMELITDSAEQYRDCAVKLARDSEMLSTLRVSLREKILRSPLCDAIAFTQNLSNVFEQLTLSQQTLNERFKVLSNDEGAELDKRCSEAAQLVEVGKLDEAAIIYEAVLADFKFHPRALHAFGVVQYRRGNVEDGIILVRNALKVKPDYADALFNLGKMLDEEGHFKEASDCYLKILEIRPDDQSSMLMAAMLLNKAGRLDDAISTYRNILLVFPDHFDAVFNLGQLLLDCRQFENAEELLKRAHELAPANVGVLIALGNLAMSRHDLSNAEIYYMTACKIDSKCALAHANMGHLLTELNRINEAIEYCNQAVLLNPDFALGWMNLGVALSRAVRNSESISVYRRVLELEPGRSGARSNLLMLMNYMPEYNQKDIYKESLGWNETHGIGFTEFWVTLNRDKNEKKKIRVGFVSADFKLHPVSYYLLPVIENYDKSAFEFFCYSNFDVEDEMTEQIKKSIDQWRNILNLSDDQAAEQICQDRIDILVDLSGHTAGNRLLLFARKPSPIQVSWLGYPNTTGLSSIDYLISDAATIPVSDEQYISEKVIRLPSSRFCYAPPPEAPSVSIPVAAQSEMIIFASFNNVSKISTECIKIWSAILREIPFSKLILKWASFDDSSVRNHIVLGFKAQGISADRLEFQGMSPRGEMLAQYAGVDICLDTYPFSGGATTCDALWMGVPVVTLSGDTPISRQSASFLTCIGHAELVADTEKVFLQIVKELASDRSRLAYLRSTLRDAMTASLLCDGVGFTANLQQVFREMWEGRFKVVDYEALPTAVAEQHENVVEKCLIEDYLAFNDQGNNCSDNGNFDSAIRFYQKALEIKPDYVEAHYNMGLVYYKTGNIDEAIRRFNLAISISPDFAEPYVNLSNLYLSIGRLDEAVNVCNKALKVIFDSSDIFNNLGSALMRQGCLNESIAAFRKAIALKPDYHQVHSNILFLFHSFPQSTASMLFDESLNWDTRHGNVEIYCHAPDKFSADSTLRIGLVSPDFRLHPVGYFIQSFMTFHDRSRFEVYCYSDVSSEDRMTKIIRHTSLKFRDVRSLDDAELAAAIFDDRISILIDLAGHTNGNRLKTFAMKPAPVQVTWAGYVGTTGLSAMDYLISDRHHSPAFSDEYASETIVRMPNSYISYNPLDDSPEVTMPPVCKHGYITFGSFNKSSKLSGETVVLWADILKRVNGSRLFMKNGSFSDRASVDKYVQLFTENGIPEERLIFEGPASHLEMLASYSNIDIQLDTFPYSGGLTTIESLWMGVPVVTLPGELFSSRHSLSHLVNAGFEDGIASNRDEYINIACSLASNPDNLSELRAGLRLRLLNSPICNGRLFTHNLQKAFFWMWGNWINKDSDATLVFGGEDEALEFPSTTGSILETFTVSDEFSIGLLRIQQKDFLEAAERFERVVSIEPDNADAHNNLGIAYFEIGFRNDAMDEFKAATKISPEHAEAWKNLGKAIRDTRGNPEKAARCFRKALKINPNFDDAWMMLGNAILDGGRCAEAVKCFKKALELNPNNCDAHSNLLFAMNYLPQFSQSMIFSESIRWNDQHTVSITHVPRYDKSNQNINSCLRIGYVSGDFKRHPVGYHLLPVLAAYNREKFEVFCYASTNDHDEFTELMQGYVTGWRNITKLSDNDAAKMICDDRIDILVDLSGHSGGHRLLLFANKPAPIQLSWLGYFNTTGVKSIDYLISDESTIPPDQEQWFSEKIIRLPGCRFCYSPPDYAPPVVEPPFISIGYVTFGSFNNISKLTPEVIELWSKVLMAVPDSRLIIKWYTLGRKKERDRLLKAFARHGIFSERLALRGKSTHFEMLQEYGDIDIALDPFPFTGGLTSCEALWMGVPVLTLLGDKPAGRQTAAFLRTIGLPDFITSSQEQLISRACEMPSRLDELKMIRFGLRKKMIDSTLCDGVKFTKNLEEIYYRISKEHIDLRYPPNELPDSASEELMHDNYIKGAMLYNDGIDLMEAGKYDEALSLFERAVSFNPDFACAHNNLGILFAQIGEDDDAEQAFLKAISVDSSFAEAYNNLGLVYEKAGRHNEAIESFNTAITLNHDYGEAYLGKGNALLSLGEPYEALDCYEMATLFLSESAVTSNNIGRAHLQLDDNQLAEQYFSEALRHDAEYIPAYINLSTLYSSMGRISDAEQVATNGLGYFPDNAGLLSVRAGSLIAQSRIQDALNDLRRAVDLEPDNMVFHSNLLFAAQYADYLSSESIFAMHKSWSEHCDFYDSITKVFQNCPDPDRKLVIGYVSPDFRKHPVGYFLMPVLPEHNRRDFQVICYSDTKKTDHQTLMLESNSDIWHDTSNCSDQELFDLIATDCVDILVDLAGHTGGNRLTLFARKAAPIQVTWAGYVGTTGLTTMDYLISDCIESPDYADEFSIENIVRLPDGYICYQPPDYAPDIQPLPAILNGYVTFGCFNNLSKINTEVIELWSKLLLNVPDSRIFIKTKSLNDIEVMERYKQLFADHGIDLKRVILEGDSPHPELLAAYNRVDISLDPFPYSGGLTTLESLWMGVPVVTLGGDRFCSRHSMSHLTVLGLIESIAENKDDYIAVARKLADDIEFLTTLRLSLRDRMAASPLCDGIKFTNNLEVVYREMWRKYVSDHKGIKSCQ